MIVVYIEDKRIENVYKLNYIGSRLQVDESSDMEIRKVVIGRKVICLLNS